MTILFSGIWLGSAAVLAIAGGLKARNVAQFELALVRLLPARLWEFDPVDSRRVARMVCTIELVTAAAMAAAMPAPPAWLAAWAGTLFAGLALLGVLAARRRVACNCGGGDAPATWRSVAATATLGAGAVGVLLEGPRLGHLTVGSVTALVAVAAAITMAWLACHASSGASLRQSVGGVGPDGAADWSRRRFLRTLIAAGAAAVGLSAVGSGPAYAQAYSCQGQHDLCAGCCGPYQSCRNCCIQCYSQCILGVPCAPHWACSGCWPGPYPYG